MTIVPIQNKIVFVGQAGAAGSNNTYIYTINPDGSQLTQLTAAGFGWAYATATPDGTRILAMKATQDFNLFAMAPDGSGVTQVNNMHPNAKTSVPPTFSPDGRRFVLPYGEPLSTGPAAGFCIVNLDNSGYITVPVGNVGQGNTNTMVYWSPDGKKLAFPDKSGGSGYGVSVCNIDGTNVTPVKDDASAFYDVFGWYADSAQLLIQAMGTNSPFPVTIEKLDGTVLYTDANETHFQGAIMGLSPDDTQIVFFDGNIALPNELLSILAGGVIKPFFSGPPTPIGGINASGGHYLVQWVDGSLPAGSLVAGAGAHGVVRLG